MFAFSITNKKFKCFDLKTYFRDYPTIACIRLEDKDEMQVFVLIPKRDEVIHWLMVQYSFN
jgi:hypothetical protein